ncbi:MAG: 1,4-dihydroxy-2-naphthoate octaprenyltransferase [Calditrichaeota bacterium]|jgi:1,4-dihydroxy-2-naphthoate polyprenyltransferase|nr:1,4-dihydroxy-2-naphthoate octaprenyltransferase [Calditrichota bacterium]MBT7618519.1 1,4-dihydroxy-2-naphthoate octaprenyltransferase [Calditrichota bacterium]MBT7790095.1 1,4-dihydroxy-2-naphthoate octaprenyltransferase [Calditrichota bacterium]
MSENITRSRFSLWMQAVRPFAYSASIVPVLVGTALAYFVQEQFNYIYFIAAMLGGVLLHSGTNLVSEYFDLKSGADTIDSFGSSRILVEGLMKPKEVLRGGIVAFGAAFLIGIFLVYELGWVIVALGLVGILGGYFYTADPFGYKYVALGEPLVFTLMGPLMVFGAFYVQTQQFSWTPIWVSIPVGILVAGILNANNLRDIPFDTRAKFKTIPSLLGWKSSRRNYRLLVASAYVTLIGLVVTQVTPPWTLIAMISLIPSLKLHKIASAARPETPSDIATLDISTAQLHMLFGLLLSAGFVLASIF